MPPHLERGQIDGFFLSFRRSRTADAPCVQTPSSVAQDVAVNTEALRWGSWPSGEGTVRKLLTVA